jgi:hypothetical protein
MPLISLLIDYELSQNARNDATHYYKYYATRPIIENLTTRYHRVPQRIPHRLISIRPRPYSLDTFTALKNTPLPRRNTVAPRHTTVLMEIIAIEFRYYADIN